MVYVTKDGTVAKEQPWGVSSMFWGVVHLVYAFFQTLIPGLSDDNRNRNNFRSSGGRVGGGGGGGSGWGWSGGSPRPRGGGPRGGNIHTLDAYSTPEPPPCAGGSCCG